MDGIAEDAVLDAQGVARLVSVERALAAAQDGMAKGWIQIQLEPHVEVLLRTGEPVREIVVCNSKPGVIGLRALQARIVHGLFMNRAANGLTWPRVS